MRNDDDDDDDDDDRAKCLCYWFDRNSSLFD